jgi:small-conductance mechanosensitive channel
MGMKRGMGFVRRLVSRITALPVLLAATPAIAQSEEPLVNELELIGKIVRWEGVLASLVLIVGTWLALRLLDTFLHAFGRAYTERRLLLQKLGSFIRFGAYGVLAIVVVLLSFELDRQILVLIGGTLAVAAGFAFRDAAGAIIAGVLILIDRPFQLGDRVRFGGEYGDVIAMGLRSVKLRTLDDSVVTIPNSRFMTDVTVCGNYGVLDMQIEIDFHIGIDQDVETARRLVREATVLSSFVHLPKSIEVLVSEVIVGNALALEIKLRAYVLDTTYEGRFRTDVTLRVHEAFREHRIGSPTVLHREMPDTRRGA